MILQSLYTISKNVSKQNFLFLKLVLLIVIKFSNMDVFKILF